MPTISKSALVAILARKADISKKDAAEKLESVFDTIIETVKEGNAVTIAGVGTFKKKESAARSGRNPLTGKPIEIKAKTSLAFKAVPSLKI